MTHDVMINEFTNLVPIEKFFTFVRPLVGAEVPDALLSHHIQEAGIWFAQTARVLTDRVTIRFQERVREYALKIPPYQYLLGPDLHKKQEGRAMGKDWANYFFGDIFAYGQADTKIERDGPYPVLIFNADPAAPGIKTFSYNWQPKRDYDALPNELREQWMEPIKYRAASEICRVPGEAWTSAAKAQAYDRKAELAMTAARRRVALDYQTQDPELKGRTFIRPAWGAGFWGGF